MTWPHQHPLGREYPAPKPSTWISLYTFKSKKPTDTEEQLLGELASLMTQLNLHQEKEEYEKCAEIKKKIDKLKKKINKLWWEKNQC